MNSPRIILAALIAGCMLAPSAARAQINSNRLGGYGIFGDGSNINGSYNGSVGNNFNRNFSYTPSQVGQFAQQAYTGSYIQPLSRFGLGANGASGSSSAILSSYLGLLRPGAAVAYSALIRPNLRQDALNGDWATNFRQAERQGEEELRARQGLENNNQSFVDWSLAYKEAMFEGEKEARRRAGENPEPEFRDWATSYKDQEIGGEAKAEKDRARSKQRAANVRQAQALKELEGELTGNGGDRAVAPPSLASGLQSYHGPGYPSQFKSMTHYYPTQGQAVGRIGGR